MYEDAGSAQEAGRSTLTATPGAALATEIAGRLDDDLEPAERVRLLQAAQRQVNYYQGLVMRLAGEVAGAPDDWDFGREEVAAALRVSTQAAATMISAAREVAARFPRMGDAIATGEATYYHALRLVEGCAVLDDAAAARVDAATTPKAATLTVGRFGKAVERAVLSADPAGAAARHAAAVESGTDLRVFRERDGMAGLLVSLRAPEALEIFGTIDSLAGKRGPDDSRSLGRRRVDALLDLVRAGDAALADVPAGSRPRRRGARRRASVVVSVETLLHLAEHPGELPGYGPISAPLARELAADAAWQAFVTDTATGYLTGLSTSTYVPTERIRSFVEARDGTCQMVTCGQPAYLAEKDHTIEWPNGPTSTANIGCRCKRHHLCRHHTAWDAQQSPDGVVTWTSPLGFTYEVPPEDYRWELHLEPPPDTEPPRDDDQPPDLG